jgi:hypothetical protein
MKVTVTYPSLIRDPDRRFGFRELARTSEQHRFHTRVLATGVRRLFRQALLDGGSRFIREALLQVSQREIYVVHTRIGGDHALESFDSFPVLAPVQDDMADQKLCSAVQRFKGGRDLCLSKSFVK